MIHLIMAFPADLLNGCLPVLGLVSLGQKGQISNLRSRNWPKHVGDCLDVVALFILGVVHGQYD